MKNIITLIIILLLSLSLASAIDYTEDNVAFYIFKGASTEANALLDWSSNDLNLTNNGSTFNSSLGFVCDGSNDVLWNAGTDNSLDFGNDDFVLCAWVRIADITNLGNRFISKGNSGNGGYTFGMNVNNDVDFFAGETGENDFFFRVANGNEFTDNDTVNLWCIVADRDSTTETKFYINTTQYGTFQTSTIDGAGVVNNTLPFEICDAGNNYFEGEVEAVYLWKGDGIAQTYINSTIAEIHSFNSSWNPYTADDIIYNNTFINSTNFMEWGECPNTEFGFNGMWFTFLLLLFVGIIGIATKNVSFSIISGFFLIFFTLITWQCAVILGIMSILIGIVYLFVGLSIEF